MWILAEISKAVYKNVLDSELLTTFFGKGRFPKRKVLFST